MTDIIETQQDHVNLEEFGIAGPPGRGAYLHVKWAASEPTADGDISDTPNAWIGLCTDSNVAAPEDYTAYAWYQYKGAKGDTGAALEFSWNGTQLGVRQEGEETYTYVDVKGETGETGDTGTAGRGITSIARTTGDGTAGTTDTYTITYSDLTTSTFDVYNGADGVGLQFAWDGTQIGVRREGDASYTYVDLKGDTGDTGATGRGITSIARTSGDGTAGTTDTYTIAYSDSTTSTFNVYNGTDGVGLEFSWNGTQLGVRREGETTYTYVDVKGETGDTGDTGAVGRGITSIARTSGDGTAGTTDTYTITYSDSTTSTFNVYNGTDGQGAGDMLKSTYDTDNDGKVDAAEDSDKLGGWPRRFRSGSSIAGEPCSSAASTPSRCR